MGIQVKHWNNDVGFEDVAKTLGVAQKFNKVIIVSTKSGFTSQAWTHARDNPYLIELWDSDKFEKEMKEYVLQEEKLEKQEIKQEIKINYFDYVLKIDLAKITE